AVITVGCGDKMFWGRIAAKLAHVPVVASALHSTGWPDGVGRLNRLLTPWTDAFIAVATDHGRHLVEMERFPESKVTVIPNGVDTDRFRYDGNEARRIREEFNIPLTSPVAGIVAALRPEKNHEMFLSVAKRVKEFLPDTHFIVVGDGLRREELEQLSRSMQLENRVHFLGTRSDTPAILSAMNVFCLTSHNEANPVSILEALSVGIPVVATDVGSVRLTVKPGITGFLAEPGNESEYSDHVISLLEDRRLACSLGEQGRDEVITHWSLQTMVNGYQDLIRRIYASKVSTERSSSARTIENADRVLELGQFEHEHADPVSSR
ncbi:MAG: glycosyltransferase, partial [Planctomycetales bacterium]|nr:glycosyltransferase [Planctomycetales bacterium]